jgi:ArsR family transcriptional regulator
MSPETFFRILSDQTRLRSLMLIQAEKEVCVCELTFALEESQPKISRHLALMRDAGIVTPRREGTWIHYRINPEMPSWVRTSLEQLYQQLGQIKPFPDDWNRLKKMTDRPGLLSCA